MKIGDEYIVYFEAYMKKHYCAMRSRVRAQALLDQGYEADLVDQLPEHASGEDLIGLARDRSGESERVASHGGGAERALRTVEIVEHYIRVDADGDGRTELWRVVTGDDDGLLLDKERVDRIVPLLRSGFAGRRCCSGDRAACSSSARCARGTSACWDSRGRRRRTTLINCTPCRNC